MKLFLFVYVFFRQDVMDGLENLNLSKSRASVGEG